MEKLSDMFDSAAPSVELSVAGTVLVIKNNRYMGSLYKYDSFNLKSYGSGLVLVLALVWTGFLR